MQSIKRNKLTAFLLVLVLVVSMLPMYVFAAGDETKLTIIHVNDRHGRTVAEAYISQMVKDLEADGENYLLLDAGDSVHGQTPANLSKGEVMVEIMNAVGYDAMTTGNHDFNYGVERLQELSEEMNFPLLAANVKTTDGENLFQTHVIFEFDDMTVGVFGIATPETVTKADPRITAGLTFEDPATVAEEMADMLKAEGCDLIIALAHLGLDEATIPANRSTALAEIDGIDVIIDGHSHTLLENGMVVGDAIIAQTGEFGKNIGVVEITLNGDSKEMTAKTIAVTEDSGLEADEVIVEKIAEEEAKIEPITAEVVGNTPVRLEGDRTDVRTGETNMSNLIADSMRWATNADMAFLTGGNIRAAIEAGEITMGDVLTTLPFSNLLVSVELSGADIMEMLEYGVSQYPEEAAILIHVSGLSFEFEPDAEQGQKVKSVMMSDGTALDTGKTYTVGTSEFLAAGGDGYTMVANGKNLVYYGGDADALADYIRTNPTIEAEAEGRLRPVLSVVPIPAPIAEVPVEAAPAADPNTVANLTPAAETVKVAPADNVYIVKPGDHLSKIASMYDTTWNKLYELNRDIIKNPDLIYPEQVIKLP